MIDFLRNKKTFMGKLMEKRHATKFEGRGPDGKTQYVPYHDVVSSNEGKMKFQ